MGEIIDEDLGALNVTPSRISPDEVSMVLEVVVAIKL